MYTTINLHAVFDNSTYMRLTQTQVSTTTKASSEESADKRDAKRALIRLAQWPGQGAGSRMWGLTLGRGKGAKV